MKMNGNSKNNRNQSLRYVRLLLLGAILSIIPGSWGALNAQTLACNGTPNSPLNVGVDENCEAEVFADMILEDPGSAVGPYTLVAMTLGGNLITQGPEPIIIPGFYLGQTIAVTVIDDDSGNQCTGYMSLDDNLAPLFVTCPTIDIICSADLDPNIIGFPNVSDNCDANFTLNYFDQTVETGCTGQYIAVVTRTWVATDASGNQSQCTQTINLEKADLGDVVFPPDYDSDCGNPVTDPLITGMPTIDGFEIMIGGICDFITSYQDQTVFLCQPATHSYLVIRTWTIFDNCTGQLIEDQQVITVDDETGPTITCPDPIVISAESDQCSSSFFIPTPTATDNCSPDATITFDAIASFGGVGFGPFFDIPVGGYMVTYSATDECGNMTNCTVSLDVVDDVPPTAICDEFTVASVNSLGEAIVPAGNLDDGSYDNCGPVVFTASRNNGISFAPFLVFDCDDVGMSIDVILRVAEASNPSSYNDCEVVVNVMDNLPPVLVCPPNETVDCFEENGDLSQFGYPTLVDNCPDGSTMVADSLYSLDNCGEGFIRRTFIVTDGSGNTDDCEQFIFINNLTPYDGSTIDWPDDYTLDDACIESDQLDPQNLPPLYAFPDIPDHPCTMPAWNYSDQIFYINYPGCYKIIRTWTVMDWCTFDPEFPENGGIWYHTQTIKLNDNTAPVLTVPGMQQASVGPDCGLTYVSIPEATATDCNTFLTYSNDSPFADAGGADASGFYPLGETLVTFEVEDGCGNVSTGTVLVKVTDDSPPTPTCIDLVTELSDMGPMGIVVPVDPNLVLLEALDNCTAETDINVTIQPQGAGNTVPTNTEWIFTCDDVGPNPMEIWVEDEAGNADFCVITVIIQDNFVTCPPMSTTATIAGFVEDETGDLIVPCEVNVSGGDGPDQAQTGGDFIFELETGEDYSITAMLDEGPGNGVTTYDLVLISKHILGVDPLDTPYKIIAADANNSGTVSTLDMVDITKVILFMENNFPNNTSWRFVDADYEFPDPADPFAETFPEVLNYNDLEEDDLEADFIGIKIGDVNGSADPNLNDDPEDRTTDGYRSLAVQDTKLQRGERYQIAFYPNREGYLAAWQFTLDYNPQYLDIEELIPGDIPGLDEANFGLNYLSEGLVTAAWFQPEEVHFDPATPVFTISFTALQDGTLPEALDINSRLTTAEAYSEAGERFDLGLTFRNSHTIGGMELLPSRPNPFREETVIGWILPDATTAQLTVFDLTGKVIFVHSDQFSAGYHELTLDASMFGGAGTYFYRLETDDFSATRRMVLLKQ
jgi:hypothetical protein